MSLGQSIRVGVKWGFLGNIGSRLMDFVFGVALARLLMPADFGMILTISTFTGFASMVMSGGMGQSLIRAKEVTERDYDAVFTMQLTMSIVIYIGFFFTAPLIGEFFHNRLYADLIRVSALAFFMRPFTFMRNAWLNREMEFRMRSMVDLAAGLLTGVTSILMAWTGMGVWSLILSGLVGALAKNILLALISPVRLRLNFNWQAMRKHSSYGFKITANDFLSYLTLESKNLILSKFMGPAFLGLYNKAESLSRIPNQLFMSATIQPVFRALSKVQDDLDQTKYMFYRVITLLMVYTTPLYVGLWWVSEPFIGMVYGAKWLPTAHPLCILVMAGIFFNIMHPCAVLLDAQNRLAQEMVALVIRLIVTIAACFIGMRWGLTGVAWAILASHVFSAVYYYVLARNTISTSTADLVHAIMPGLILNSLLFGVLGALNYALGGLQASLPAVYLIIMTIAGIICYMAAFLFLPIPALKSETEHWKQKLSVSLPILFKQRS
jgi:O-antigen/teichoic acid export membrane protein